MQIVVYDRPREAAEALEKARQVALFETTEDGNGAHEHWVTTTVVVPDDLLPAIVRVLSVKQRFVTRPGWSGYQNVITLPNYTVPYVIQKLTEALEEALEAVEVTDCTERQIASQIQEEN